MLENIPPPHSDTTTASSDVTGRSEDEEPTTVVTTGDMLEVAGAGTPGPVETATRGGETTFFFGRGTQSAEKKNIFTMFKKYKHFHKEWLTGHDEGGEFRTASATPDPLLQSEIDEQVCLPVHSRKLEKLGLFLHAHFVIQLYSDRCTCV